MCVRECVSIRCLMSVQELESIAEKAYKSFSKPFHVFFEIFIAYFDQNESKNIVFLNEDYLIIFLSNITNESFETFLSFPTVYMSSHF